MNKIKQYRKQIFKSLSELNKEDYKPNRKARRSQPTRFMGNKKGISLTIHGLHKYIRRRQIISQMDGTVKTIQHYELSKSI